MASSSSFDEWLNWLLTRDSSPLCMLSRYFSGTSSARTEFGSFTSQAAKASRLPVSRETWIVVFMIGSPGNARKCLEWSRSSYSEDRRGRRSPPVFAEIFFPFPLGPVTVHGDTFIGALAVSKQFVPNKSG